MWNVCFRIAKSKQLVCPHSFLLCYLIRFFFHATFAVRPHAQDRRVFFLGGGFWERRSDSGKFRTIIRIHHIRSLLPIAQQTNAWSMPSAVIAHTWIFFCYQAAIVQWKLKNAFSEALMLFNFTVRFIKPQIGHASWKISSGHKWVWTHTCKAFVWEHHFLFLFLHSKHLD